MFVVLFGIGMCGIVGLVMVIVGGEVMVVFGLVFHLVFEGFD